MPICHGYHGLFESCGGGSGAAGSDPIHRIGGMRHEVTLWHLARHKDDLVAKYGQEGFDTRVRNARRKAREQADLTPQAANILTRERDHLAARLATATTLAPTARAQMRAEVMLLNRHLKRADAAADLRAQRTRRLAAQVAFWEHAARSRRDATSRMYADKLGAELEAYTRREPVHYVHYDTGAQDTLRTIFGHAPTRSEIAHALGAEPGSDITLSRRGAHVIATVHAPGHAPHIGRHTASQTFDLFRDLTGRLRREPIA